MITNTHGSRWGKSRDWAGSWCDVRCGSVHPQPPNLHSEEQQGTGSHSKYMACGLGLGSESARKFQRYHFWLRNSIYISVLTSLTLGFQFLNRWKGNQNKSIETTQAAVKIRGAVSEGSETPTRELACRLDQVEWWSWLSGVRWEPSHLTSLLCRKRHRSKTNQMAQQVRALLPSLATWVGIPRTLPVEGEKRNSSVVPWPSQTCLYMLTSQSPVVYMCNCRVGRTFVKCDTQKVTQLQIFKSVGAEVGCSQDEGSFRPCYSHSPPELGRGTRPSLHGQWN